MLDQTSLSIDSFAHELKTELQDRLEKLLNVPVEISVRSEEQGPVLTVNLIGQKHNYRLERLYDLRFFTQLQEAGMLKKYFDYETQTFEVLLRNVLSELEA